MKFSCHAIVFPTLLATLTGCDVSSYQLREESQKHSAGPEGEIDPGTSTMIAVKLPDHVVASSEGQIDGRLGLVETDSATDDSRDPAVDDENGSDISVAEPVDTKMPIISLECINQVTPSHDLGAPADDFGKMKISIFKSSNNSSLASKTSLLVSKEVHLVCKEFNLRVQSVNGKLPIDSPVVVSASLSLWASSGVAEVWQGMTKPFIISKVPKVELTLNKISKPGSGGTVIDVNWGGSGNGSGSGSSSGSGGQVDKNSFVCNQATIDQAQVCNLVGQEKDSICSGVVLIDLCGSVPAGDMQCMAAAMEEKVASTAGNESCARAKLIQTACAKPQAVSGKITSCKLVP